MRFAPGVVDQKGSRSQGSQVSPLMLAGLVETRTAALTVSESESERENERERERAREGE